MTGGYGEYNLICDDSSGQEEHGFSVPDTEAENYTHEVLSKDASASVLLEVEGLNSRLRVYWMIT